MPLKKILLKPGVNKENTRYTTEGGWYDMDKVRFRQGTPEKIGGWLRISTYTFLGVCRALWNWVTLGGINLMAVGTNLKYYLELGGIYNDITPIRSTVTLNGPFTASTGSYTITVADNSHGCRTGDFVTFSGAVSLGGAITATVLNQEYQVTVLNANSYTITAAVQATSGDTGHGGASVVAAYQLNTTPEYQLPINGWGAGPWGLGTWGNGESNLVPIRIWSQNNFGQDLIFGPRGGAIYYWSATSGVTVRAVNLNSKGGTVTITNASPAVVTLSTVLATGTPVTFSSTSTLPTGITAGTTYYLENVATDLTCNISLSPGGALVNTSSAGSGTFSIATLGDVPIYQNYVTVSDVSRFVIAFGCNDYGSSVQDPMLVRWSDQEDALNWTPTATNQAGSLRLSHGSQIITAIQNRQEIVVITDSSVYSMQYLGPPYVWSAQLLADNISIVGQNAWAIASGVIYWMGVDKFYKYDGRVQTMRCDLRQYIFNDINSNQNLQIFASTNEGFNEVWWFYCSANSVVVDKYVVYNYAEDIWYYGTMGRTAWIDSGLRAYPIAATYSNNLVYHENGVDNNQTSITEAINAYISSSEFDIDDGHNFGFIWRILPDITFRGSQGASQPQVTMSLIPLNSSGSGYTTPPSVGGLDNGAVTRITTVPVEEFTGYVYIRVRGRQLVFKIESNQIGTAWQLGAPRIDIRPDGRR